MEQARIRISDFMAGHARTIGALIGISIVTLLWVGLCSAGTIYYYKDEHGVMHFTDTPQSKRFQPFMSLRALFSKADPETITRHVQKYSQQHGVDPHLIMAVIEVESGFNHKAVSRVGAQGLMQIMPITQKELGLTAPFNPGDNIEV